MIRRYFSILLCITLQCLTAAVVFAEATHVLQRGETAYSVARRYNVPIERLLEANGISDPTRLSVGTRLVIPESYRVEKNDTLWSIARRYGITVDELRRMNNKRESDVLRVGELLVVPRTTEVTPELPPVREPQVPTDTNGAAPADAGPWPHPGPRERMDGKFPGIAIRGTGGDEILSVSSGRVIYAGTYSTFGRVVFVQSVDGFIYVYGGTHEVSVKVGDLVRPGTVIGKLGSNGEIASRVYFSVWKDDAYINPETAPRG
ncbi:MAG: M23 family metallopeptidase [Spirochaetaceae bacterium]|nr:MAG: M23 family metallopeptidase [Spirochaetaceae bacterium]